MLGVVQRGLGEEAAERRSGDFGVGLVTAIVPRGRPAVGRPKEGHTLSAILGLQPRGLFESFVRVREAAVHHHGDRRLCKVGARHEGEVGALARPARPLDLRRVDAIALLLQLVITTRGGSRLEVLIWI